MKNCSSFQFTDRSFDDENAASQFKESLIEKFCSDEVSSAQVAAAFSSSAILKKA